MNDRDSVCEMHFDKRFIVRSSYHCEYNGKVYLDAPKRPKLTSDAIPWLFPWIPPPRKPRQYKKGTTAAQEPAETSGNTQTSAADSEYVLPNDSPEVTSTTVKQEPSSEIGEALTLPGPGGGNEHPFLTFSELLDTAHLVPLPSEAWAVHILGSPAARNVIFTELVANKEEEPVQCKTLSVSAGVDDLLVVRTSILGRKIECSVAVQASLATSVTDLGKKLKRFHEMRVCLGGRDQNYSNNAGRECAYIDSLEVWRHKRCSLFSTNERCPACTRLC